jgi:hypothetical protein
LLDTCVLSELRRPKPDPGVQSAIAALSREDLFVSVLSLGEIAKGIALLKDGRNKSALQTWLQWSAITPTASCAARKAGRIIPALDGLIAATARRHGLYVMTRNTTDFEPTGALLLNPWQSDV